MAHYAKVRDGVVVDVIAADESFFATFVDSSPGRWIQTSYNTRGGQHPDGQPLRKNFAGVGYTYDAALDAFIPPKPFASWVLDAESCLWVPPVPYPEDGRRYAWSEIDRAWNLLQGDEE